jgi:murein DD-endopeptidase MepM/ murein hydrolase activator NlpD
MGLVAMLLAAPCAPMAAEPLVFDAQKPVPTKRFFPLDSARQEAEEKKGGVPLKKESKPFVLRTDTKQMDNGFMRIDRARTVPAPAQHALPTRAKETPEAHRPREEAKVVTAAPKEMARESEEIEGNNESYNPVLSLFGHSADPNTASFAEAMRGHQVIAGLGAHPSWPIPTRVKQYVSSGYGMRKDPFHGRPAFHGGIDIVAPTGTPVLASADGRVTQVAADGNYGKYIAISHSDGTTSRYGHLSAQSVTEGTYVRAGQTIGAVGSTGRSTGSHLDYRVSKNDMKFDPLTILKVPTSVALRGVTPPSNVATGRGNARVAQNATPRRPMVIKVQ